LRMRMEEPIACKGKQRAKEYRKMCGGGWSDKSAMVSNGTDQLSAAVRLGNVGENRILLG
jgi:hypothetical protein